MKWIAAIVASILALAVASAFADEKRLSKLPRKAAVDSKVAAPGKPTVAAKDGTTAAPAPPQAPTVAPILSAMAVLKSVDRKDVGTVTLTQTPSAVRLTLSLSGLPPGEHAFHVHAVGRCEPPFTSAGPHFNPENKKHGYFSREGHHAGDMPNLLVPASGNLTVTVVNSEITLERGKPNSVFQDGGTALVIHATFDDYVTDPAGNAGDRIACGVIR
jgi:Cu-Zn family superoxide dismutase